jgi:hypothetical protein
MEKNINRRSFIKSAAVAGIATTIPLNSIFAKGVMESGIDKLVDNKGNFVLQQNLPESPFL